MNDRTLMERVVALEQQVLTLVDMLLAVTEVLEDQGISSKAEIKRRSDKIQNER